MTKQKESSVQNSNNGNILVNIKKVIKSQVIQKLEIIFFFFPRVANDSQKSVYISFVINSSIAIKKKTIKKIKTGLMCMFAGLLQYYRLVCRSIKKPLAFF